MVFRVGRPAAHPTHAHAPPFPSLPGMQLTPTHAPPFPSHPCLQLPGVEEIHDLHVWSLTPGIPLLCAHINMSVEADPSEVLHAITTYCRGVGIEHSTVQLVVNGRACPCACVPASLE